jgi:hypothetical protein
MQDFSLKTSKGDMLKSMMRNPETSKLVKEAMASSLGSTSRAKAKKIFSIMSKLHQSYDGIGGPGMMYDQMSYGQTPAPEMDPVHIPTDNSKGMVVFHKIPKPKITYGNKASKFKARPGSYDGKGGIGDIGTGLLTVMQGLGSSPYGNQPSTNTPIPSPTPATNNSSTASPFGVNIFNNPNPYQTSPTLATQTPNVSTAQGPAYKAPDGSYVYQTPQQQTSYNTNPVNNNIKLAGTDLTSSTVPNTAARNVASFLGVDPSAPLSNVQISSLMSAIARNEGYSDGRSQIAINNNNPGNLKYTGQAGATRGQAASDGGYYAKFSTAQDGWNAMQADLQYKISSGKYTTVADLMNTWSPEANGLSAGPVSKYSGLSATAQGAVNENTGAGMFAMNQILDPNNPFTHGKTLGEIEAANQQTLWDKYNIGGLQDMMVKMTAEGATLPSDVTAYIKGRDQFLQQTDQQINNFITTAMSTTAMSDPANATKANAQLNYLYTLRGRQNQSYIGYLNDAISQHQASLNNITNLYSTALNSYENELKNSVAITESQYNMYTAALSDMYTAVDGAPMQQAQLDLIAAQIAGTAASQASDAAKLSEQTGFIAQGNKLEGYIWDTSHLAMPGTDLVKQIQDFSALDPTISAANIIQVYTQGVLNYLSAADEKSSYGTSGNQNPVTSAGKTKIAEEAITQFAHLAIAGSDNDNTVMLAQTSADQVAQKLAGHIAGQITATTGKAEALMGAIGTLNPTGWFAAKTPPTETKFVENVTSATKNPLDESLARAIYAVFQRYIADGGTAAGAVNAFLYPTSSTSDRGNPEPLTADQFAMQIGSIYASNVEQGAFASANS